MNDETINLMILDDDDVDRERLIRMLKQTEIKVHAYEAPNFANALQILGSQHMDCIILDYCLGLSNGVDIIEKIKQNGHPFCAIVMVTGLGDEGVAAAAMKAGACDYISKNQINAARLMRAILGALHRSELEKRLHEMAYYDALTHLASRTLFLDRLQQTIAQKLRNPQLAAVVYIDLDHFKPINDTYGHTAGDYVLVQIADRLKDSIRKHDTVARFGGDEFALLLHDIDSIESCERLLISLQNVLTQPIHLPDEDVFVNVSASIGVTLIENHVVEPETLLRQADQTMYDAKNAGRNNIVFFDRHAEQKLIEARKMLVEIEQALDQNQFCIFYQPKINLSTQQLIGFEALIRWQHPELGMILPDQFRHSLDHKQLGIKIGNWMLKSTLAQMATWAEEGFLPKVSVNISAHHLQQKTFITQLQSYLIQQPSVPAQNLELEILETVAIDNFVEVCQVIEACHELGISLALDDFGTGYSSLAYLKKLPLDTLKIDKSFVINMLDNQDDCAIVAGVIGLCKTFGRNVIAEGVETNQHMLRLMNMGCEFGQGYGISLPIPAEYVSEWYYHRTHHTH